MKNNQESVTIAILKAMEPTIRTLAHMPEVWESLDVNYYPPRVERLYTTYEGYRIFLHHILNPTGDCLYHKHRWPAAFKQLAGAYEMGMTYSEKEVTSEEARQLPTLAKFYVTAGTYYEMTQTDCLHYVKPDTLGSSSIMITHNLYPEADIRKEALNRKLSKLTANRKAELLEYFQSIL